MVKPKVFIRVEAGFEVGFGHLIRCIALSNMLRNDFYIHFFSYNIPDNLYNYIKQQGYGVSIIENDNYFFSQLTGQEIVVLDNYNLGSEYEKHLKNLKCKVVCIDDLHDRMFYADLIINHAPGVTENEYFSEDYTQFALGLDYALLRPGFLSIALQDLPNKSNSLMICFGGSDYLNLTHTVLDTVLKNSTFNYINVIIGEGYKHVDSLLELVDKHDNVTLHRSLREEQMLEVMKTSEFAIVPSSGILMECIAVGLKIISGMYVENQKLVYNNFKSSGAFVDAGDFSVEKIKEALFKLKTVKISQQLTIDGKSAERINRIFKSLILEKEITLRKAELKDIDITYKWAIDPKIRKHSFAKQKISEENHKKWYRNKLESNSCYYYIAENNSLPIGSIRYDIKEGEAVISFLVDSNYQGKGYGRILLKKGYSLIKKDAKEIQAVVGYVMPANIPSVKSFLKLGYSFCQEDEGNRYKFFKNLK